MRQHCFKQSRDEFYKPNQILCFNTPTIWWHSFIPAPPHNSQTDCPSWNVFDKKRFYFLHINGSNLLPKIEEIRFIAKKSKATVIGISETKLDGTIFDAEIYIEG